MNLIKMPSHYNTIRNYYICKRSNDNVYRNKCNSLQSKILHKEKPSDEPFLFACLTIFVSYYLRKTFK